MRSRPALALLVAAPWLAGCGAAGVRGPAMHGERVAPPTSEVGDDAFAAAVHDLLVSEPGSAERATRLRAVEARQMARADARFHAKADERGLAAVSGGLYLVRVGEPLQGLFGPHGSDALRDAARFFATRGDEGRARATYDLLLTIVPPGEQAEIRSHVEALSKWTRDTVAAGGPVASAGGLERVAAHQRLLEPTREALAGATAAASEWIQRAVIVRDRFRKNRVQPPREEGAESWRALETGPAVLASLYLRDGDATGGMSAVDHAHGRELLESERPQLASALEALAKESGVDRCIDLLHQLRPLAGRDPRGEDDDPASEDRDLFGAATFGVATECYRLDPTVPEVAMTLGVALAELGMAEATPAVLGESVRAHPDAGVVSQAMALSLDAMTSEEAAGDSDAARRVYRAALPLVAVATQPNLAGKVHPGAARLRASMGDIELRQGRIEEARALFKQSVAEERSGAVLLSLARIERRDAQPQAALDHLREALAARDATQDAALRGEVLLNISDIACDRGDVAGARTPLTDALKDLVQSRNAPEADARARVERVLARVLDRFGAVQPAERALERAYAAAPGNRSQAAQTIELLIGRAFVRGDVSAARDGLQHALGADLDADDLVYFALWVRLLERQLHVPTDGTADRIFASTGEDGRWSRPSPGSARASSKGTTLIARAASPIQRYEALFYDAMDHRAAGDTKGGDDLLRQVVAGTGVELSEVSLARDMLDPATSQVGGPLPSDVAIP